MKTALIKLAQKVKRLVDGWIYDKEFYDKEF